MGLGKTRQAISFILGVRDGLKPVEEGETRDTAPDLSSFDQGSSLQWERALVLAPATLVRGDDSVWSQELRKAELLWRKPLKVWRWHGERTEDFQHEVHRGSWKGPMVECFDVVITSYESFLVHQDKFVKERWTCVVLDEAQTIKRHCSQTAAAVKRLAGVPFRLALTGSPIENSLDDIHSILQFVEPGCAGSLQDFRQRFPDSDEGQAALKRLLQFITLRREGGEAVKMVAREEVEVPVRMSDAQKVAYEALKKSATSSELVALSLARLFREMELLCTHPWCYLQRHAGEELEVETMNRKEEGAILDKLTLPGRFKGEAKDQRIEDSGKLVELFSILRGVIARRDKVLVFFCRTVTSDLLAALIEREFGTRPGVLRGDTPQGERERIIRDFKADPIPGQPHSFVLLLSVWVGAVGLNLPEARWVVHVERVWNPALERQATSRVHRLTSKHPVKAYCLYTEETVEERKSAVLSCKHRLSAKIMEALDGDIDGEDAEGDKEASDKTSSELRALISEDAGRPGLALDGKAALAAELPGPDECEEGLLEEGEHEADEDDETDEEEQQGPRKRGRPPKRSAKPNRGLYPDLARLRPRLLKQPLIGKYGDPRNNELWDWYTVQGRKEVHAKAPTCSTAGLGRQKIGPSRAKDEEAENKKHASRLPFTIRPTRIRDVRERDDRIIVIDLGGGTSCRLFVPLHLQERFLIEDEDPPALRIRPPGLGDAPVPIFTPSSGRSAVDDEVGLLDLSAAMVDGEGKALKYLHIVAVRPSEVEKYRLSAPFFVVMELPQTTTVKHPTYGDMKPEDLGVGCARHWLVRLASALQAEFVFLMDDSLRCFRGVTLVDDPHPMFGLQASPSKARFSAISMARVLSHCTEPKFLAEDMRKIVAFGFARFAPDLVKTRRAYSRSHMYSAFLLNVKKVEEEALNFRQDLFVWEDFIFNLKAHDVVKCNRFAQIKQPYRSGGCSVQVATSENPIVRALMQKPMTAQEIVDEAYGEEVATRGKGRPRNKAKADKDKEELASASGAKEERPVPTDPFMLEEDPALKLEGAVCDAYGGLVNTYYKRFIQAFKDAERAIVDMAAPSNVKRPGVRSGETMPDGIRFWDDCQSKKRGITDHTKQQWGAGYIAYPLSAEDKKKGSKWFNVKTWGSWRMTFVLARLQHQVWKKRYEDANPDSPSKDGTGTPKASRIKKEADGSERKNARGRAKASAPSPGQSKDKLKCGPLDKFFVQVKQEPTAEQVAGPKQTKLSDFLNRGSSSSASSSSACPQSSSSQEPKRAKLEPSEEASH
eukprot:TRINITY_DN20579_c0_g1_i2.p1 TRINITY_DN20579_c0_g1~~TRINITY_DN20579_c0_g1_i2.p1  ORF type:complete len:1512 (+),score=393.14 TRINITY_DN20579_c0_g1_i2:681-4538(+)